MKTLNVKMPVELTVDIDLDAETLTDLGLGEHVDSFLQGDTRGVLIALSEMVQTIVDEKLSDAEVFCGESRTDTFFNDMNEFVTEIA